MDIFIIKRNTRKQNLAFVRTYTFRMKSTESFINETPGVSCHKMLYRYLHECCLWLSYTDVQKSAYFKLNICSELNITSLILCRHSFPTWWTFGRWATFLFFKIYLVPPTLGTRLSLFIYKNCMSSHCPTLPCRLEEVISAHLYIIIGHWIPANWIN